MFLPWMKFAFDASMLTLEAQQVITLRVMKMSLGGAAAQREANLMVSEKMFASAEAVLGAAGGRSMHSALRKVRHKVRANRRRLIRT